MTLRRIANNLVWFFKKVRWPFVSLFFLFRKKKFVELPFTESEENLSERTRYVDKSTIVIEIPPCKRVVHTNDGYEHLSFPFIYFIIKYGKSCPDPYHTFYVYSSLKLGFSGEQLESSNGLIGKIPISNYHESFKYCLGDGSPRGMYDTLKQLSDIVVANFWQTSFQMSVDKQWLRNSKRIRNHSSFIESMINQKVPIKVLMEDKYVKFHQYVRPVPLPQINPAIEPSTTSRTGPNGYKKRIRRRHKQSPDRQT